MIFGATYFCRSGYFFLDRLLAYMDICNEPARLCHEIRNMKLV